MPRTPRHLRPAPAAVVTIATQFGANIAAARINRRWRQEDLAAKAGVDRRVIMAIEQGQLGVGLGACIAVLWAMGLAAGVADLAGPRQDVQGQRLAPARATKRVRRATALDEDWIVED